MADYVYTIVEDEPHESSGRCDGIEDHIWYTCFTTLQGAKDAVQDYIDEEIAFANEEDEDEWEDPEEWQLLWFEFSRGDQWNSSISWDDRIFVITKVAVAG